jgi:hypothetical protein
MTTSAAILMIVVQVSVICITAYFFVRVLRTPSKSEPDSFTENDE